MSCPQCNQISPKSGLISYHQSGCLAGWEQRLPKDPSEGRPAATESPVSLISIFTFKDRNNKRLIHQTPTSISALILSESADLMGLRLGPVLQSGKDTVVALDDPVLLDGERLEFSGGNGHAETDLQNPTACQTKRGENVNLLKLCSVSMWEYLSLHISLVTACEKTWGTEFSLFPVLCDKSVQHL